MTVINTDPLVLRDVVMTIAGNDYQTSLSEVTFTPSASAVTWKGMTPTAQYSSASSATWAAALTYVQDWETPNSLSQYLMDNEGSTVTAVFRPRNGRGPTFTAQLVIIPGAIGGKVDTYGETTVSLGCQGRPVRSSGVAVIPTTVSATPNTSIPVAGGKLIKLVGTSYTGTTGITVGGTAVAAGQFIVESDTVIYFTAPARSAGAAAVIVTNATGPSTVNQSITYV